MSTLRVDTIYNRAKDASPAIGVKPPLNDDSTQAASTAWVQDELDDFVNQTRTFSGDNTHSGDCTFSGDNTFSGNNTFSNGIILDGTHPLVAGVVARCNFAYNGSTSTVTNISGFSTSVSKDPGQPLWTLEMDGVALDANCQIQCQLTGSLLGATPCVFSAYYASSSTITVWVKTGSGNNPSSFSCQISVIQ
jgi:hypothetical protein